MNWTQLDLFDTIEETTIDKEHHEKHSIQR